MSLCSRQRQHGLTLIELLVAMVIFSFVVGVFSQALYQISLLERRSSDSAKQWSRLWRQGFALDDAYKTQLAIHRRSDAPAVGTSVQYEGSWVHDTGPQSGRAVQATLRIRPLRELEELADPQTYVLTMQWSDAGPGPQLRSTQRESVLAQWPVPVRLRYISVTAAPSDVWPPLSTRTGTTFRERIPKSIQVETTDGRLVHSWLYRGNPLGDAEPGGGIAGGLE